MELIKINNIINKAENISSFSSSHGSCDDPSILIADCNSEKGWAGIFIIFAGSWSNCIGTRSFQGITEIYALDYSAKYSLTWGVDCESDITWTEEFEQSVLAALIPDFDPELWFPGYHSEEENSEEPWAW